MNPTIARAYELISGGKPEQAEAMLRRMVTGRTPDPHAAFAMSRALLASGRMEQALHFAGVARRGLPESVEGVLNEAAIALAMGKPRDAQAIYEAWERRSPGHADVLNGLIVCAAEQDDLERAEAMAKSALAAYPGNLPLRMTYAKVLEEQARSAECHAFLKETCAMFPGVTELVCRTAFAAVAQDTVSPSELAAAHNVLGERLEREIAPHPTWPGRAFEPERPLRLAFVSPDLRNHPVAYFLEPLLEYLDRGAYATTCYSLSATSDGVTSRLRRLCANWREAAAWGDEQLAIAIQRDAIDVLVDLAGLSQGGRPGVFARTPAPLQVTYLGYPFSTGLSRMDVRLVDSHTDPPGSEALASERLVRFDPCFLCYRPPAELPPITARDDGAPIRFGSFNALHKLSDSCLALWATVLASTPGSRLVLKGRAFSSAFARARFAQRLERLGLDPGRVDLLARTPERDHLASYRLMDIALDPFPYNGTTTTCEALTMGVPVITLAGEHHPARVGVSLLHAVGLGEFVASSPELFVAMASALAADRSRLSDLRSSLRERVRRSVLCDGEGFARRWQDAVRTAWRARCEQAAKL